MTALLVERAAYLLMILPAAAGVYLLIAHRNLLMAVVGLYLVQSAVIFFYVLLSVREGATVPILDATVDQSLANPLPHALMLTAIVVGVATLGMALAILRRIQEETGSIEEPDAHDVGNRVDAASAA
jgi:multicomponent Na+:H+ antiporter subunit C